MDVIKDLSDPDFLLSVSKYVKIENDKNRYDLQAQDLYSQKCTVCRFILGINMDNSIHKELMSYVDSLPMTYLGCLLVWYRLKQIYNKNHVGICYNIKLICVFTHFFLDLCPNSGYNFNLYMRNSVLRLLYTKTLWKLSSKFDSNRDCQNNEVENDIGYLKLHKNDYKKIISSVNEQLVNNTKKGGCQGYNEETRTRCIYSNIGSYDQAQLKLDFECDARIMVSPQWAIKNYKSLYYDEVNFMKYQPGFLSSSISIQNHADSTVSIHTLENITLVNQNNNYDRYSEVINIFKLIDNIHNLLDEECHPLYNLGTGPCRWCSVSIIPEIRWIFQDLIAMGKAQLIRAGIWRESFQKHKLMLGDIVLQNTTQLARANQREQASQKQTILMGSRKRKKNYQDEFEDFNTDESLYSLDLDKPILSRECLELVYDEWCKTKYPFLTDFLKFDDMDGIINHCLTSRSVFCEINKRRLFYGSDERSSTSGNHSCLLPFIIDTVMTLNDIKDASDHNQGKIEYVKATAARHHLLIDINE